MGSPSSEWKLRSSRRAAPSWLLVRIVIIVGVHVLWDMHVHFLAKSYGALLVANDPKCTDDRRMKYLPHLVRDDWNPKNDFRFKTNTAVDFDRTAIDQMLVDAEPKSRSKSPKDPKTEKSPGAKP